MLISVCVVNKVHTPPFKAIFSVRASNRWLSHPGIAETSCVSVGRANLLWIGLVSVEFGS
jgi:hypothetical protein